MLSRQQQKQPTSKVDVNLKIDSKESVIVEKVKTTGVADMNLDIGNFAVAYD